MELISRILNNRYQELQDKISSLLERSTESEQLNKHDITHNQSFSVNTQISSLNISFKYLPDDSFERALLIFSLLTPYADAGLLLIKEGDNSFPQALFKQGELYPPYTLGPNTRIQLPKLKPNQVIKGNTLKILSTLELEKVDPNLEYESFLFQFNNDCSFILFFKLAEPWLKNQIEYIQKIIIKSSF